MKVDNIIQDLEQSLAEMSEEYKLSLRNKSEAIIQSVEYRVVGKLVEEIIETDYSNKERVKQQVFLALAVRPNWGMFFDPEWDEKINDLQVIEDAVFKSVLFRWLVGKEV